MVGRVTILLKVTNRTTKNGLSCTFFSPLHFDLHEYRYCLSFLTIDLKAKISQNFGNEHSTVCIRHYSVLETTFKFKSVSTLNEYF